MGSRLGLVPLKARKVDDMTKYIVSKNKGNGILLIESNKLKNHGHLPAMAKTKNITTIELSEEHLERGLACAYLEQAD